MRAKQGLGAALPAPGCTRYMNISEPLPSMPELLEASRNGRGQRKISFLSSSSVLYSKPHLCWLDSSGSQVGRKHITDMDKSFLTPRGVPPGTLCPQPQDSVD